MNLDVLNKLSTDGLLKIQGHIEELLKSRLDITLRVGRIGTFHSRGEDITVVITRINGKSVSGEETGVSVKPGRKWRVDKGIIKVEPMERKTPTPVRSTTPHRPASVAGDAW